MGKKESKSFRERIGLKKGKDGTKRSEEELLYLLYSPEEIQAAEERMVDRKIEKRDKKIKRGRLADIPRSPENKRNYYYKRIMPENGKLNEMGITEEQFYDPKVLGYKEKYMISAYRDDKGEKRAIKVESRGEFTDEEKEEYNKIMKANRDLERMQKIFAEEEK